MTVQISTLRVGADFDASNYVSGAAQKQAADKGMVDSARQVQATFTQTEAKISQSGDVLSRLSRQFVDGYASAQKFETAINALTTGVERGKIEMQQATVILDGIYRKYGMMADASKVAARGQGELAKAIEQANAKLAAQQSIKPANQNTPTSGFATANLAAQFQDIAVTAAMGMSPIQIALQQGTQIAGAFGDMGAAGAVKTLGAAFVSLVSPVSLASIGLTAAAAAGIQYFSSILGKGEEAEKVLKKQQEAISDVAKRWGDALPSLKAYAEEQDKLTDRTKRGEATSAFSAEQWKDLRKEIDPLKITFADVVSQLQQAGTEAENIRKLQGEFNALAKGIDTGKASATDAKTVQSDLLNLFKETGLPVLTQFAGGFDKLAAGIEKASGAAARAKEQNALVDFMKSLPALGTLNPMIGADGRFISDAMEQQNQRAIDAANASPTVLSNGRYITPPTPLARPNIELDGLPGEAKTGKTSAEAYRDLVKSANDRIEQLRLEAEVSGKTGIEAQKLRFQIDLLQQSQDKGRSLSEAQRKEIERLADAYAKAAENAARVKLNQDLRTERGNLFLSSQDQQISGRLRGAGLPVDLQSNEADYIRQTMRMQETKTAITGFFTDFRQALVSNGGKVGKALGETLLNSLANVFSKASDQAFERIANSLVSAVFGTGGTSTGSVLGTGGGIVSGFISGGKASNDNLAAPVTSVARSALADVTPTTDVASYITQAATLRGIDPSIALKVAQSEGGLKSWNMQSTYFKNGVQEQSYGPYQLYMNGGLGNVFQKQTGLDPRLAQNGPAGVDFALDYAKQNGWGSWYGAAKVGVGKWDGIGTGSSSGAADAISQLATSAKSATQGLNSFGGGLGQIGQTLSTSFFPAAPTGVSGGSGGGLFSWLGGLFGGGGSSGGLSKYLGLTGLFADGTESAPGGMAVVGERGPELVNLPRGSQVVPTHRMNGAMKDANRGGSSRSPGGVLQVVIQGASGDEHVRSLVQQGVAQGLALQQVEADRGGFATTQQNYIRRKG